VRRGEQCAETYMDGQEYMGQGILKIEVVVTGVGQAPTAVRVVVLLGVLSA
jgi:hypothetical protein